jgi:hypothetical protein
MFTATGGLTDVPFVVLALSVGVWGSNVQHRAINLLKMPWAPLNRGNLI